jgi:hypothetical protein
MNKFHGNVRALAFVFVASALMLVASREVGFLRAQSSSAAPLSDGELIAEFRRVEVASVSDALEQITGKRMYMSHRMQPIFTAKFAGFARTVQLKKDEGNKDPEALTGMLEAIDQGSIDSVYVMVVEDGEDIAGMGGLMGTAMAARGYSGAVIDGGVRDVAYLRKIGFRSSPRALSRRPRSITIVCRRANSTGVQRGFRQSGRYCVVADAMAWPWCSKRRRSRC